MGVQLVQLSGCVHSLSQNTWLQVKRLHKKKQKGWETLNLAWP